MTAFEYKQAAMQHFGVYVGSRMTLDEIIDWYHSKVA